MLSENYKNSNHRRQKYAIFLIFLTVQYLKNRSKYFILQFLFLLRIAKLLLGIRKLPAQFSQTLSFSKGLSWNALVFTFSTKNLTLILCLGQQSSFVLIPTEGF